MNDENPTSVEVAITVVILAIVAMVTVYYFGWLILCALPFIGFKSLFSYIHLFIVLCYHIIMLS